MGNQTPHIGGGKSATRGGAPWIPGAHARGLKNQMTPEQLDSALAEQTARARVGTAPGVAGTDQDPAQFSRPAESAPTDKGAAASSKGSRAESSKCGGGL